MSARVEKKTTLTPQRRVINNVPGQEAATISRNTELKTAGL
jgi:hypothetical protein